MDSETEKRIVDIETKIDNFRLHTHDNITSLTLVPKNLQGGYLNDSVVTTTSGTDPINVFGGQIATSVPVNCPFNLTVRAVYLISNDATAGTITVKNDSNTIATLAKGATAGAMVGATSLTNTRVTITNALTVVSSSAGNAQVIIIYQAN